MTYEADPDGVESVCDGHGHGNGGSPERDLWRAARVRGPGGGEEAGGCRQDQLCEQVCQGCLRQCQGEPVRESGRRQEAGRCGQEQLRAKVREDGRGRRQGDPVREGGGGQEARRGGQEQLYPEVRQDHLSLGPGVSERLGKGLA